MKLRERLKGGRVAVGSVGCRRRAERGGGFGAGVAGGVKAGRMIVGSKNPSARGSHRSRSS